MVEYNKDDKGRLSFDVRDLEAGETIIGSKQFDNPLRFPVKRKGSSVVVGQRYMYKLDVPGVGDVAMFVNDSVMGSGPQGTKLYELIDSQPKGTLFGITKKVGIAKASGRNYSVFNVAGIPAERVAETTGGVTTSPATNNAVDTTVDTTDKSTGESTVSKLVSTNTVQDDIKEVLGELGLSGNVTDIAEAVITNIKVPSKLAIKDFIITEAKKAGAL